MALRNSWYTHWTHVRLHLVQLLVKLVRVITQIGNQICLFFEQLSRIAAGLHQAQRTAGTIIATQNIGRQLSLVEFAYLVCRENILKTVRKWVQCQHIPI